MAVLFFFVKPIRRMMYKGYSNIPLSVKLNNWKLIICFHKFHVRQTNAELILVFIVFCEPSGI